MEMGYDIPLVWQIIESDLAQVVGSFVFVFFFALWFGPKLAKWRRR